VLIDTHAHLDYPEFQSDFAGVLQRALDAGVTQIISIGTSLASSARVVALASEHPMIHPVIGVHPTDTQDADIDDIRPALKAIAGQHKIAAIGETGLDYHRLPENPDEAARIKERQARHFRQQLELAVELALNVVIHQRDAWDDTVAVLSEYTGKVRGVFHCFGGTPGQVSQLASMGHLMSFTGIVTFKNAAIVRESAQAVPSDGYMVETDCPYLAPVPHRGGRCEPWHTRLVAEEIARVRNRPIDEIAAATTQTARQFFRLQ
jgi:TatD DNase family protein